MVQLWYKLYKYNIKVNGKQINDKRKSNSGYDETDSCLLLTDRKEIPIEEED